MADRPYMPSNGTEGMMFEEQWCERCIRHSLDPCAKTQCIHLLRALAGEDNGQWFHDGSGRGECRAYKSRAEAYRNRTRSAKEDKKQLKMFV